MAADTGQAGYQRRGVILLKGKIFSLVNDHPDKRFNNSFFDTKSLFNGMSVRKEKDAVKKEKDLKARIQKGSCEENWARPGCTL
jgi:hypothetical protein